MTSLDLSFLSVQYDHPAPSSASSRASSKRGSEDEEERGEGGGGGEGGEGKKAKKTRNRKHHSCEPCRQRKVKCDRQSNCAMCRMHHRRCYYEGAQPVSNSAEDELVAAREEINRLRELVRMLMTGRAQNADAVGTRSSSPFAPPASPPQPPSSSRFPVLSSPSFARSPSYSPQQLQASDYAVPALGSSSTSTPPPSMHHLAPSFTAGLHPPSTTPSFALTPPAPAPLAFLPAPSSTSDLPVPPPSYYPHFDPSLFLPS